MPKPSKSYHHGDLRNVLVKVAARMIEKRRDVSFTLRELAAEAGVSHAAAYRHFAGKNEILAAVAAEGFAGLHQEFVRAQAAHPRDSRAELIAQGQGYVRFATGHPGHFRAMFHADLGDHADHPGLMEVSAQSFASLLDCVTRGARSGKFVKRDPMQLAVMAWSAVHGLATLAVDGRLVAPDGQAHDSALLARVVTELLMTGFDPRR